MKTSTSALNRRDFLRWGVAGSTAASLAFACQAPPAKTQLLKEGSRLRHAAVGVGGMGAEDLKQIASHPDVDVVALCDVDADRLKKAAELHPKARTFSSWHEMFAAMGGEIDSVHVTIPDHNHAIVAAWALSMGMHVYCQKPLTHDVLEARMLERAAERHGAVTQMGIQNHAASPYRSALAFFQSGVLGAVSQVHVWTDRPAGWWPQNVERPDHVDEIPPTLDWNQWLGTAPERPFTKGAYHAFVWRGRKDFGTGAQGDMACHLMDPALWFLDIRRPSSVHSIGPMPNTESYPLWSEIHYRFPPSVHTGPDGVEVVWCDGKRMPEQAFGEFGVKKPYGNASLFVGASKALMVSPYESCRLFERGKGEVKIELPLVSALSHWHQFVDACFGRAHTQASFAYAAPLSEVALLGNVAMEFPGQRLRWDAKRLRFPDTHDADAWLKRRYREGWELPKRARALMG